MRSPYVAMLCVNERLGPFISQTFSANHLLSHVYAWFHEIYCFLLIQVVCRGCQRG